MSGSSRAERVFSRCVVAMDAGISISWAPDENGSIEHGMRHHQREEDEFRARIDAATPAIEVVLDELESSGRAFLSPGDGDFHQQAQRASTGMPIIEVALACSPPLDDVALKALVDRVAQLITAAAPAEPDPPRPTPDVTVRQPAPKPWWRFW